MWRNVKRAAEIAIRTSRQPHGYLKFIGSQLDFYGRFQLLNNITLNVFNVAL